MRRGFALFGRALVSGSRTLPLEPASGRVISSSSACAGKDDDGSLFSDDGEDTVERHRRRREEIQDILKGESAKVHDWSTDAQDNEPADQPASAGDRAGRSAEDLEEELSQLSPDERAAWHRRVETFIDSVYGQREEPPTTADSGMEDRDSPRSLHRVLATNDPIRRHFLEPPPTHAPKFVDYCIFCYHGTEFLRDDNTALLSQFVSHDGRLLPKRFTHLCAKHQRKMARTVKRSQNLNLLPYEHKLHPRLRFTSLRPDPAQEQMRLQSRLEAYGGDRSSLVSERDRRSVDEALQELQHMTHDAESGDYGGEGDPDESLGQWEEDAGDIKGDRPRV